MKNFNRFLSLGLILLAGLGIGTAVQAQDGPPTLFADHKARRLGDMVTILVQETTNARRESQSQQNDNNRVNVEGGVDGNLLRFLPVFGLRSTLKTNSDSREGTSQRDQITGRIAAVITEVSAAGLYTISGSKLININGERNLMTIKGQIRSRDINSDNTIFSYNIVDTKIYYSKAGLSGKYVKRGSIPRLANLIMGGAGLALIGYVGGISALAIIRSFAL